jgi:serine/threonine protein kinase
VVSRRRRKFPEPHQHGRTTRPSSPWLSRGTDSAFPDSSNHHFVFARVLLTSEDAKPLVKDPRARKQVLTLIGCEAHFLSADQELVEHPLESLRARFVDQLVQLRDRPRVPREIDSYRVLDVIGTTTSVRTFKARHEDGFERGLKVIERPGANAGNDEGRLGNALLREYQALQRLGESGRTPRVDPRFRWDQDQYWVVPIHPLRGMSLRANRGLELPSAERVWQVLESSFAALSDVHAEHVVHRALTPDSVHILTDGAVMFSDFAVARIQGEQSIASVAANLDYEHAFLSPECRIDLRLASPASDVYSLAFSLLSWITGAESDDPEELFLSLGDTTSLDDWAIDNLSEVFADCFLQQPDERPSASQLLELIRGNRALVGRSESPTQGMLLQPGAVIDDQYEVIRLLGQGGTGRSYLAKDFRADMFCVLKTIENPELVTELARTEFGILVNLHHENIWSGPLRSTPVNVRAAGLMPS